MATGQRGLGEADGALALEPFGTTPLFRTLTEMPPPLEVHQLRPRIFTMTSGRAPFRAR